MSYFFSHGHQPLQQPHHLHHHHQHSSQQQQQQQQQQHSQSHGQQHPLPPTSLSAPSSASSSTSTRRRSARPAVNSKHFRGVRSMRDLAEAPAITAFRARFEAGRSFDLDDDLEFCPGLLTEDDLHSIQSSASDRSSLASISPDSSPLQHQITPATHVAVAPSAVQLSPSYTLNHGQKQLHQAPATAGVRPRNGNAIPIVNPSTGMRVASPPSAIHPNLQRW